MFTPNDENNPEKMNLKRKGLRIYSSYVSSKTAHLKLDNYAIISAKDFVNYGTIYLSYKLRIDETFNITRIGIIGSENGIDFNIGLLPIFLDESFYPVVNGASKMLNIVSKDAIEINDKIDIDLRLNIESSKVCIKGDLTSKALKVKTSEFYIKKGERKKYEVASQENFEIYANWFRRYKTAY